MGVEIIEQPFLQSALGRIVAPFDHGHTIEQTFEEGIGCVYMAIGQCWNQDHPGAVVDLLILVGGKVGSDLRNDRIFNTQIVVMETEVRTNVGGIFQ
ncbi:MAG: hypothetical protein CVV52_19700 [Spirochaetae bacterium HGW-Spirochaetae-8]|nr:MAG: hypothetical protein CVV52_19700 [Spirochaetae bacterium HGW-Spirochaetae-8]